MFYKQLERLKEQFPQRFKINYVLKDNKELADATQGRLDQTTLKTLLAELTSGNNNDIVAHTDFYICGATELNSDLHAIFANNISHTRVHIERFTAPLTPAQGRLHQIDIKLGNHKKHRISVAANQTVLEVALANEINLPYGCNSGHCGSCICKIEQGSADNICDDVAGISRAEKAAGYVLSCQCKPLEDMKISVNL